MKFLRIFITYLVSSAKRLAAIGGINRLSKPYARPASTRVRIIEHTTIANSSR